MHLDFAGFHAAAQELPANSFDVVYDNLKSMTQI